MSTVGRRSGFVLLLAIVVLAVLVAALLVLRKTSRKEIIACSNYDSRVWAQSVYETGPAHAGALDPDGNGLACETLPLGVAPALWTTEVPAGAAPATLVSVSNGINRGINFFAIAVLAMLATSTGHGLQTAANWASALDEIALGCLAGPAVGWYLRGRNRYRRSLVPLTLLALALAAKLAGMWITSGRLVLGGPDFTVAAFLAETLLVVGWPLVAHRETQAAQQWREARVIRGECRMVLKIAHFASLFFTVLWEGRDRRRKEAAVILKVARFVGLLLGALNLGLAWAHFVEMAPKRVMSGSEWLTTQQAYRDFGKVAGITVPAAVLSTLTTLVLVRGQRTTARLTALSVGCTVATVAIWARFNEPVNREVVTWRAVRLPADWQQRRDQWEFAHAASAVLHGVGLAALLAAALGDESGDEP